jgi:L-threonylcarbamoyladenylate synthase
MVRKEVIACLKRGGIGVMPTDTIYGVVGSALCPATIARLYRIRRREEKKPFIVLVASSADLKKFGVRPTARTKELLRKIWPGPVTVILPCLHKKFVYLHRGTNAIAFRVPKPAWLRTLIEKTGPLAAPSANIAGKPPARTIKEAKRYFSEHARLVRGREGSQRASASNRVDFYVDGSVRNGAPSSLIEVKR